MPIIKTPAFQTSDSKTFLNREEAQLHEIELLLGAIGGKAIDEVAAELLKHKDALVAILSTRKPRVAKAKQKKEKVAA